MSRWDKIELRLLGLFIWIAAIYIAFQVWMALATYLFSQLTMSPVWGSGSLTLPQNVHFPSGRCLIVSAAVLHQLREPELHTSDGD